MFSFLTAWPEVLCIAVSCIRCVNVPRSCLAEVRSGTGTKAKLDGTDVRREEAIEKDSSASFVWHAIAASPCEAGHRRMPGNPGASNRNA